MRGTRSAEVFPSVFPRAPETSQETPFSEVAKECLSLTKTNRVQFVCMIGCYNDGRSPSKAVRSRSLQRLKRLLEFLHARLPLLLGVRVEAIRDARDVRNAGNANKAERGFRETDAIIFMRGGGHEAV